MKMTRVSTSGKKTVNFNFQKILFGFALGLFVGTGVFFFYSQFFQISRVEVEGNKFITEKEISDSVRFGLVGNVYGFIPSTHIAFFPKEKLKINLSDKYPRLERIIFYRENLNVIKVSVVERKPEALWCENNNHCSFVDHEGYVYADAPKFSPGVFLEWSSGPGDKPWSDRQPIEPEYFGKLISVSEMLSSILKKVSGNRWQVTKVEKGEADDWMFGVSDREGQDDWKIFVNGKNELEEIAQSLNVALDGMGATAVATGALPKIDYADLRFGNKIFYRLDE